MTAYNPTMTIETLADVIRTKGWCDKADKDQLVDVLVSAESEQDAEEIEKKILNLSADADPAEVEDFLLAEYSGYEEEEEEEDVPYGY